MRAVFYWRCLVVVLALATGPWVRGQEMERIRRYLDGLEQRRMGALAAEYVRGVLASGRFEGDERAELELELTRQLVAGAKGIKDLAEREAKLEEAKKALELFLKERPKHAGAAEALISLATIDLEKGRLLLLRGALPANANQSGELRGEARKLLVAASKRYDDAHGRIDKELRELEGFIDAKKDRRTYDRRQRLFASEVESAFQSALAKYFVSETYLSEGTRSALEEKAYRLTLEEAVRKFDAVHAEHRRELSGLYARLWSGRCHAGLGDYRKASAIFESLLSHENRALESFQREVFHFQLLALFGAKDYAAIVSRAPEWLKVNGAHREEPAYQGVQLVSGKAHLALGKETTKESDRRKLLVEGEELLSAVARGQGPYAAEASRAQLDVAKLMGRDSKGTTFEELSALAGARLDELSAGMSAEERETILEDAIARFEKALANVKKNDDSDQVAATKLQLAFAFLEKGDLTRASDLAEEVCRQRPAPERAADGGVLALSALARRYEGAKDEKETLAARIRNLATYVSESFPESSGADQARLLAGRLALREGDEAKGLEYLLLVKPGASFAEARSLAGSAAARMLHAKGGLPAEEEEERRAEALGYLSEASKAWGAAGDKEYSVLRLAHDTLYLELCLEGGKIAEAKALADEMQKRGKEVLGKGAATQGGLVALLRTRVAAQQIESALELVRLIYEEKGEKNPANWEGVLMGLLRGLREDIERRRSGEKPISVAEARPLVMFLEEIDQREEKGSAGLKIALAEGYLAAGAFAPAERLLEEVTKGGGIEPAAGRRVRLLLARSSSLAGNHAKAKEEITALLKQNPAVREIVVERGEILERAGAVVEAIGHWQWYLERLRRVEPRPVELYEVADRVCGLALEAGKGMPAGERAKLHASAARLPAFLLETDKKMPATWRAALEARVRGLKGESATSAAR